MGAPTIVVGIDFSEGSRRALGVVRLLARGAPARLRLVHVFPPIRARLAGAERRSFQAAVSVAEVDEAAQMTALAEGLRKQGFDVDTAAVKGKAAATLLAQARRSRAGLLAIGSSGRKGLQALFVGSVAQAVLRDSPIPVLVTPARNRGGSRRAGPVLAGVDLGPTSHAVLETAGALASDLGVGVHAFYAIPIPFVAGWSPDSGAAFTPVILAGEEQDAAVRLTELVEKLRSRVKVQTTIGLGDAGTHLLAQAVHVGASAIVVGRRKAGRRLGSVSSAVVHAADRPVIVVPVRVGSATRQSLGFGAPGDRS